MFRMGDAEEMLMAALTIHKLAVPSTSFHTMYMKATFANFYKKNNQPQMAIDLLKDVVKASGLFLLSIVQTLKPGNHKSLSIHTSESLFAEIGERT